MFLLNLAFFSKISFSLQKEEDFRKKKTTTKNNKLKVAKLLTYGGQVIDPTAYIKPYIYIYAVKLKTGPRFPFFYKLKTGPSFLFFCFLFSKISFSLQKEEIFEKKHAKNNQKNTFL